MDACFFICYKLRIICEHHNLKKGVDLLISAVKDKTVSYNRILNLYAFSLSDLLGCDAKKQRNHVADFNLRPYIRLHCH